MTRNPADGLSVHFYIHGLALLSACLSVLLSIWFQTKIFVERMKNLMKNLCAWLWMRHASQPLVCFKTILKGVFNVLHFTFPQESEQQLSGSFSLLARQAPTKPSHHSLYSFTSTLPRCDWVTHIWSEEAVHRGPHVARLYWKLTFCFCKQTPNVGQKCGTLAHKHNCRIASVNRSIWKIADSLICTFKWR